MIKQALIDEQITYSQAKVIKSKLKTQAEITKILEVLKNKKLSVNELKTGNKRLTSIIEIKIEKK